MLRTLRKEMENSSEKKRLFWGFKLMDFDSKKKLMEFFLKEGIPTLLYSVLEIQDKYSQKIKVYT